VTFSTPTDVIDAALRDKRDFHEGREPAGDRRHARKFRRSH
jgi:hypothetical protein